MWETMSDIDGVDFIKAVVDIVKTQKEFYPGTNIIAVIREKANEAKLQRRQATVLMIEAESEKQRIERWKKEAVPMPDDCRKALSKLGVRI